MINNLIESLTLTNVNGVPICGDFYWCRIDLWDFLTNIFVMKK